MLANRLPLLLAFAAGSLGTALVGFGRGETARTPTVSQQSTRARAVAAPAELVPAQHEQDLAAPEVAASTAEVAPVTDSGNSVAEVLMRLEESYRRALAERDDEEPAVRNIAAEADTALVAKTPVDEHAAPKAAVALAAAPVSTPAPVASAERHTPPPQTPPARDTGAVQLAQVASPSPPAGVHVGDVHQNIYLGNVHQGDLLHVQRLQFQQLAMLQYMQLLALSSQAGTAPPARSHAPRGATPRRPRPFSTSLTNPDNPWGFDFPPIVLVK